MLRIKTLNDAAWKHMKNVPAHFWTISHFKTHAKCDIQVNNICEAFYRAILEH